MGRRRAKTLIESTFDDVSEMEQDDLVECEDFFHYLNRAIFNMEPLYLL